MIRYSLPLHSAMAGPYAVNVGEVVAVYDWHAERWRRATVICLRSDSRGDHTATVASESGPWVASVPLTRGWVRPIRLVGAA